MISPTADLARRALPARLDVQEPRQLVGDVDHAGGVVVDDEAGGPHSAADRREALVTQRDGEVGLGDDRVGHAREHCLDAAAGPDAAADGVDHRAERRPQLDLADVRGDHVPDNGRDDGSR